MAVSDNNHFLTIKNCLPRSRGNRGSGKRSEKKVGFVAGAPEKETLASRPALHPEQAASVASRHIFARPPVTAHGSPVSQSRPPGGTSSKKKPLFALIGKSDERSRTARG